MKKVKKLILALAAASLLASCGGRVAESTDSQPQSDSSSQIVPPAGDSSEQPSSQSTSQPGSQSEPGSEPQSEPGSEPQSEPGSEPQSEPGPGPQSEPTSEQSTPGSDPAIEGGSIFEPVKESAVNELKSTDIVDLLSEFDAKAKEAVGSSPFEKLPTAEQINQFVAMDNTGLLASAMKHNHFTKEEVLDIIDAAMPVVVKILPLIYGQNTGPLQSGENGVPQMGRKEMASPSGTPTWMQLLTDPEVKEGLINVLEKIDLDHLFATISDMEKDKDHPLDLAYLVAGMTGGMASGMYDEFYFFEETNDEIEQYREMLRTFREETVEKQRLALVEAMRVFANDDTLFPIIRLVKQLLIRGLKAIDPTAVMNDVMVLAQYFQTLGSPQALPKATAAEALADLAKILDNEFLSDADLEGLLNLLFDRFLAYWDAGVSNPDISSGMIREMTENIRAEMVNVQKLITAKSINSLFKLVRAILAGCDENAFAALEGQDIAALATIIENAYYGLSKEERDSLEAIANYLGVSIPTMFQDVARYDARTIGSFLQNLYGDMMTALQTKWKINEFSYQMGRSGNGVVQNGTVDLSGWTITSSLHGEGRFSFDGAYSTAELGRTLIPVVATFSDGTKWHLSEDVTVYPANGIGVGIITTVDSSSRALNDAWYSLLEYNYETLASAVENGSGDANVSFNGHSSYAKMSKSDMVGYVSTSFTMTLREFFNAIDPNDPYGVMKIEKDGMKLFLDLKEFVEEPLDSSEEEVEVLLYATGSFNEWDQSNDENYLMELDYGTVYKFANLDLKQGAEVKAYRYDTETGSKDWFPAEANLVAEATARYDLCVDIDSGEAWLEYMGDYQGEISDTVYYLVGGFNNWAKDDSYALAFDADRGYYVANAYLTAGGMKITDSDGLWYPGGMGNDYVIEEDGNYQIVFDPSGSLEDGHYGFFEVTSLD